MHTEQAHAFVRQLEASLPSTLADVQALADTVQARAAELRAVLKAIPADREFEAVRAQVTLPLAQVDVIAAVLRGEQARTLQGLVTELERVRKRARKAG